MIDRAFFFSRIRAALFGGRLAPRQMAGLTVMLDRWETSGGLPDRRHLAYMLATAHHETDRTMQPIREYGGNAYLTRMYDVTGARPALARRMGNTVPGDGVRYCGRGYVQLTWKNNYRRAGEALGIDLLAEPDRAMEPATAADIMIAGMNQGWFTGRKLGDCFTPERADWRGARRIINGLDKADLIKGYALAYLAALTPAVVRIQPRAASAAARVSASSKTHGPRAMNSAPVPARGFTAAASGA
jgi:putative chitinase